MDSLCLLGQLGQGHEASDVEVGQQIAPVAAAVAIWSERVDVEGAGTPERDLSR